MHRDIKDQEIMLAHRERKVSDKTAKAEIQKFLRQSRTDGCTKISIIDLVSGLHLPAEQIERIMDSLEGAVI